MEHLVLVPLLLLLLLVLLLSLLQHCRTLVLLVVYLRAPQELPPLHLQLMLQPQLFLLQGVLLQ
jgi:hypothetical protein